MRQYAGPVGWEVLLGASALMLLVFTVFYPIRRFEFVDLDVPAQVVNNPHVHGLTAQNIKHILTSWCVSSYYPVRTLSYAADYELWGLDLGGFKLTNALIHTANVLLLFSLVLRLLRHPAAVANLPESSWALLVATFSAAGAMSRSAGWTA